MIENVFKHHQWLKKYIPIDQLDNSSSLIKLEACIIQLNYTATNSLFRQAYIDKRNNNGESSVKHLEKLSFQTKSH
uniref:Uncharacterized protein n=1 Tax=Ditylenchus dipsaci TaxID=166011 RepID=A0A915DRL2_9BILA